MYFLSKKHSHTRTHTERLSQHFVRGKSFVSISKIHLCGRWQLVNKRTFDSSGCFGRAGSPHTPSPPLRSLLASSSFHHLAQMQPSAKATWQHRSLELHLPSLLLLLLLFTGISVSFRFVTRHTHTQAHPLRHTCSTHTVDVGENNVQPLSANVPNNDLQASAIYMISNKNKLQAIHFT